MPGGRGPSLLLIEQTSTLLPFLYQTRTIAACTPFVHFARRQLRPRCVHHSAYNLSADTQRADSFEEDPWAPDPSHEEPAAPKPRAHRNKKQWIHDVPFEHLETPASRKFNSNDGDLSRYVHEQHSSSTLTDPERRAFQRLFRSLGPQAGGASAAARNEDQEFANLDNVDVENETDAFLEGDLPHDSSAELESILNGDSASPHSLGESAIERYPPSLQQMAQEAEARMNAERRVRASDAKEARSVPQSPIVQQEMEQFRRIKSAMLAAHTDQDLWRVLDSQVLASMRLIQEAEDRLVQRDAESQAAVRANDTKKKPRTRKSKKAAKEDQVQEDTASKAPLLDQTDEDYSAEPAIHIAVEEPTATRTPLAPTTPIFHRLVRAYPALVLLAAQLLSRRTAYTPLAAGVLPAVKRIGLTAWALASSTPLYNELLALQWRVLHSPAAMLATLREMDHVGVPGDAATLALLHDVAVYRSAALDGRLGAAVRALEALPSAHVAADRLQQHATRARQRLHAAALERVRRGEAEGALRRQGVL